MSWNHLSLKTLTTKIDAKFPKTVFWCGDDNLMSWQEETPVSCLVGRHNHHQKKRLMNLFLDLVIHQTKILFLLLTILFWFLVRNPAGQFQVKNIWPLQGDLPRYGLRHPRYFSTWVWFQVGLILCWTLLHSKSN